MNYILEEMKKLGADGVVFHPIFTTETELLNGKATIHCEYTLKSIENIRGYPKSGRTYYKIVNGERKYINPFTGEFGKHDKEDDFQEKVTTELKIIEIEEAMSKIGIQVKDVEGNLKNLDDVLSELSNIWAKTIK